MTRDCRIRARLTQEMVANELGIDRSTVAKWETGAASPRTDKLLQLARLLNCTVDELLSEEQREDGGTYGMEKR